MKKLIPAKEEIYCDVCEEEITTKYGHAHVKVWEYIEYGQSDPNKQVDLCQKCKSIVFETLKKRKDKK